MPTAEQNHEASRPFYSIITKEEYLQPHGTPDEIISDANRIAQLLVSDGDAFLHGGINPEYINSLQARIDSYTVATVNADTAIRQESSATVNWLGAEKRGVVLKKEFTRHYPFLYRKNKPVLTEVKEVMRGSGNSDFVLDMKKYAAIGRANPAELETAPLFDMAWLDQAEAIHAELSELLAVYEAAPKETRELNTIKRQTFSWLEMALNEIREFADYLFYDDEEKKKLYKRDYLGKR